MNTFRTNKCGMYDHPEISFTTEKEIGKESVWLINFFERNVATGKRFRQGQTLQIGWVLVKLEKNNNSDFLELCEPDFISFPIQWCKGVTNTFRHLILQNSVCHELGVEAVFPSITDAGILSPCFLNTKKGWSLFRDDLDELDSSDSGWICRSLGYGGGEGDFESLYAMSLQQPQIIPFLALPSGCKLELTNERIDIWLDDFHISSQESEVLMELLHNVI